MNVENIVDAYFIIVELLDRALRRIYLKTIRRNRIFLNYNSTSFSTHTLEIPGKLEAAVAVEWQDR